MNDTRLIKDNPIVKTLGKTSAYAAIVLLIVVGALVNRRFLTGANLMGIIQTGTFLMIVCMGLGFVVFSGYLNDLSIPTTIALAGTICELMLPLGLVPAILIALCFGLLIGAINGFVIGKFRANPIIWTMSVNFLLDGTFRTITQNKQFYPDSIPGTTKETAQAFIDLSRTYVFGKVPLTVVVVIAMVIVAQYILKRTKFGKQIGVMGCNFETAKYSGIDVVGHTVKVFMMCGFAAAVAGIFLVSFATFSNITIGSGYEFQGLTACVIGGMSLTGGRGDFLNAIAGAIIVRLLANVLTFLGFGTYYQYIAIGVLCIVIVFIGTNSLRRLGKDNV